MPRKKRPLTRDSGTVRDANLIVIASEDTYAVKEYFAKFKRNRVQFIVLPTEDGKSSPDHILKRLDEFNTRYDLKEDDQLWYCGDTDHWVKGNHISNLSQVLTLCRQKGYQVALSHPCFELWLLLHFSDLPEGISACEAVCNAIATTHGGYSKSSGCRSPLTIEMVRQATERAEVLDQGTSDIPATPTTRIYRILNPLIQRESFVFSP